MKNDLPDWKIEPPDEEEAEVYIDPDEAMEWDDLRREVD